MNKYIFIFFLIIILTIIFINRYMFEPIQNNNNPIKYIKETFSETEQEIKYQFVGTICFISLLIICLCCSSSCFFCSSNTSNKTSSNLECNDIPKYFIIAQPLQPIQFAQTPLIV